MIIQVLQKYEYRGHAIYIRRFDFVFEYLVLWEQELYHNQMVVKPDLWRRLLGNKNHYSKKQSEEVIGVLLGAAEETVDRLIKKKGKLYGKAKKGYASKRRKR